MICEILVPWPVPPTLEAQSLNQGSTRGVLSEYYLGYITESAGILQTTLQFHHTPNPVLTTELWDYWWLQKSYLKESEAWLLHLDMS